MSFLCFYCQLWTYISRLFLVFLLFFEQVNVCGNVSLSNRRGCPSQAFTFSKSTVETQSQICSNLTIKTLEQRHWYRSGIFIMNFIIVEFEHVKCLLGIC